MKVILSIADAGSQFAYFKQDLLEASLAATCAVSAVEYVEYFDTQRPTGMMHLLPVKFQTSWVRSRHLHGATGKMFHQCLDPRLAGRTSKKEIYLYCSSVISSYYGWNGPRYHSNTETWSQRTQEASYNPGQHLGLRYRVSWRA